MANPILQHFKTVLLNNQQMLVIQNMESIAVHMEVTLPDCAEKSAGLRKLLEAMDCFVRAARVKE